MKMHRIRERVRDDEKRGYRGRSKEWRKGQGKLVRHIKEFKTTTPCLIPTPRKEYSDDMQLDEMHLGYKTYMVSKLRNGSKELSKRGNEKEKY